MPRVTPFYAVKCYPEPGILKLLNALGTGFDCASKGEVEMMLKMGVHPSRIIFAHPCKRGADFRFAKVRRASLLLPLAAVSPRSPRRFRRVPPASCSSAFAGARRGLHDV